MANEILVPVPLLRAACDPRDYYALHRDYQARYQVNGRDAWERLEGDLREYGLPGRYSEYASMMTVRGRVFRVMGEPKKEME